MIAWRPIPGFPGYTVSDDGQVMGKRGRLLSPCVAHSGHLRVNLYTKGRSQAMFVHRLVLLAFKGPRPDGQYCRHLNGVPTDNRLANLAWGTKSENTFDKVGHGTHPHASKTECPAGHRYSPDNTYIDPARQGRHCRTCHREAQARWRRK